MSLPAHDDRLNRADQNLWEIFKSPDFREPASSGQGEVVSQVLAPASNVCWDLNPRPGAEGVDSKDSYANVPTSLVVIPYLRNVGTFPTSDRPGGEIPAHGRGRGEKS